MKYKGILSACFLFLLHLHGYGQYKVHFIVHDRSPILREHVYISGSFNNWDSLANPVNQLKPENKGTHTITLNLPAGRQEYKFSGGNWLSVEKTFLGDETGANRSLKVNKDTNIEIVIYQWRDLMIPGNKMRLQQEKADTTLIVAMTTLAIAYSGDPLFLNVDSCVHYFQSAVDLMSPNSASNAVKSWKRYSTFWIILHDHYANVLQSLGNYLQVLEIRFENLRYAEMQSDTLEMISGLNQIADNFLQIKDYSNALTYTQRSLDLLESTNRLGRNELLYEKANIHYHLALSNFNLHSVEKSLSHAKYASQLANSKFDYYSLANFYQLIGDIYLTKHIPDSANWYYRLAISFSNTSHNPQALTRTYQGMALVFREKGQIDSALYVARLSLLNIMNNKSLFQASGEYAERYISEISPIIADLYKSQNQPDSAFKYLQLSVTLKDSVYNIEKIREFQNLTINESIRKQKQEQQIKEERQRATTRLKMYGFIAGITVLSILALFQYRNSKQKQATNLLLYNQKQDIENSLHVLQQTQKQLVQSEKMASLGELTAGIAHEIQNPLNFVNNFSEVNAELIDEMQDELKAGHSEEAITLSNSIKENQEKINFHGKRADAIVKGMLMHSRSSSGVKEPTDVNALADEYLRLAYHGLRARDKSFNATMKTDFDESIGLINIVPQDIGRVILNLITNAFYAVTEKKKQDNGTPYPLKGGIAYEPLVSVTTKKQFPLSGGRGSIEISVIDNGNGIPPNVLDKIFQPFFTTKPTGQGTGLGLSLSYDIVKAHAGKLTVETKEGESTTFIITLPI